jgi:uncharacterized protein
MADLPRCRLTSWREADGWADRLGDTIRSAGKLPQTIVGLTRGGWVPARLLADRLAVKRLVAVRARHWGVTAKPDGTAELTEGLSAPIAGETVLVVDDITDTGESLQLATQHVAAAGPARVESAALLHIAHSKFTPDYFAEEIPRGEWVWVVFPWNYWEDLDHLARRAFAQVPSIAGATELLRTACGLKVPRAHVARVLATTA